MKTKTTVILFGLFIILLVFVYLFEGPLSEQARRKAQGVPTLFPGFAQEAAAKIAVKSAKGEVVLERKEDIWQISGTDGFTADPEAVQNALETVAGFKRESIASKNPEKQDLFEVTPAKGIEVKVFDAAAKTLAQFYIGKMGADFFSNYVRKEGSDEVIQVASVTSTFDKPVENWRDKTIFNFPSDMVTRLTLKTAGDEIVLEKNEKDEWHLVKPEQSKANQEAVKNAINTLATLSALGFAEDYDAAKYALDKPQLTAAVILKDQIEQKLHIGRKNEEKGQYYARNEAKKTIFLIGKYQFDTINKTGTDLKEAEKKEAEQKAAATDAGPSKAEAPPPDSLDND
jgi:hypothetical protein